MLQLKKIVMTLMISNIALASSEPLEPDFLEWLGATATLEEQDIERFLLESEKQETDMRQQENSQ